MSRIIPQDFPAGWQAVETGFVREGDILIEQEGRKVWATGAVGETVKEYSGSSGPYRAVYRKMACPKPGDFDVPPSDLVHRTKPTAIPSTAAERKGIPVYSGFIAYFPDAIAAVAKLSKIGNDQHNPGKPLHWDRSKSGDELDALGRHLLEATKVDTDDTPHEVKVAWRAMANLQKSIEVDPTRFAKFFSR